MEPLITKEREIGTERGLDPIFMIGFEWLFMHSERTMGHQAVVVGRIFHRGTFGRRRMIHKLRKEIDRGEAGFRASLGEKIASESKQVPPKIES